MIVGEAYLSEVPQFTQACKMGRLVIGFYYCDDPWQYHYEYNVPEADKLPFNPQYVMSNALREVITSTLLTKLSSMDESPKYSSSRLFSARNSKTIIKAF